MDKLENKIKEGRKSVTFTRKNTNEVCFEHKDIIITDPCYIIRNDNKSNDWSNCEYGMNMEVLGIDNYISRNTIYGDWSCTAYKFGTDEVLGKFCADSGMVGVFDLEEVMKYNHEFDCKPCSLWTVIKDFTGIVWFNVEIEGKNRCVKVLGKGNIDFTTEQTGF